MHALITTALRRNFALRIEVTTTLTAARSLWHSLRFRAAHVITQWHAVESLMISQITRRGLIVAPARRTTDLLDELISHFDWPVLLQPSVRLLLQQIEVAAPHCLLFWLDETHEIDHALRLIARLRDRGPRPYRIAVAHQLRPDAEPTIRAAGVHSVLCTSGNITALVQEALLPLLNLQPQPVHADQAAYRHTEPLIRGPTKARASPAEMHPP